MGLESFRESSHGGGNHGDVATLSEAVIQWLGDTETAMPWHHSLSRGSTLHQSIQNVSIFKPSLKVLDPRLLHLTALHDSPNIFS